MNNRVLDRLNKKQCHGTLAERKGARRMGARATLASGALDFDKGDYEMDSLLVDSKATVHKSISLKQEWLEKIRKEAQGKQKVGAVHIQFTDDKGNVVRNGSYFVVPEAFLRGLLT